MIRVIYRSMCSEPSNKDWELTEAEMKYIDSEMSYYQQRYFQSEQRSATLVAFSGIVLTILAIVRTVFQTTIYFAQITTLPALIFLIISLMLSLYCIIPFSTKGGIENLRHGFNDYRNYRDAIHQLDSNCVVGREKLKLNYLLYKLEKEGIPDEALMARIIVKRLMVFKQAATFRSILTTLSVYSLLIAFVLLVFSCGIVISKG